MGGFRGRPWGPRPPLFLYFWKVLYVKPNVWSRMLPEWCKTASSVSSAPSFWIFWIRPWRSKSDLVLLCPGYSLCHHEMLYMDMRSIAWWSTQRKPDKKHFFISSGWHWHETIYWHSLFNVNSALKFGFNYWMVYYFNLFNAGARKETQTWEEGNWKHGYQTADLQKSGYFFNCWIKCSCCWMKI